MEKESVKEEIMQEFQELQSLIIILENDMQIQRGGEVELGVISTIHKKFNELYHTINVILQ